VKRNVAKSTRLPAQRFDKAVRQLIVSRRNTAVGNDARLGKGTAAASQAGRPIVQRSINGAEFRVGNHAAANGGIICETQGAMSLQSNEAAHGHESVPQKLPQLVGYRDPNAGSASSHRPRRDAPK
jgi:hypothetical protein